MVSCVPIDESGVPLSPTRIYDLQQPQIRVHTTITVRIVVCGKSSCCVHFLCFLSGCNRGVTVDRWYAAGAAYRRLKLLGVVRIPCKSTADQYQVQQQYWIVERVKYMLVL